MKEDEYIELLRSHLVKMAQEQESLLDERVLSLSQYLDTVLLRHMKKQLQMKHY